MPHTLRTAITFIKAGDKKTGKRLLLEIISNERHNEQAWLWLTEVVDQQYKKIDCLKQVLKINPHNETAQKELARLTPVTSPYEDNHALITPHAAPQRLNQILRATIVNQLEAITLSPPPNDGYDRQLERIATALERIADILEQQQETPVNHGRNHNNQQSALFEARRSPDQAKNGKISPTHAVNKPHKAASIEDFLKQRNITIKFVPSKEAADMAINSLSLSLGNNYAVFDKILAQIKYHMQRGSGFTHSVKDESSLAINQITSFCKQLYDIGFLKEYKYYKSPRYQIKIKTTTAPAAKKFFSGQWLERFVWKKAEKAVNQAAGELRRSINFSYLINPQIILPNGDDFEFDLIFQANHSFFWVESKSGAHRQHTAKYAEIANVLGLDARHSIMVLTDISRQEAANIHTQFGLTVYTLDQVQAGLIETLKGDFG
ncbi:MAG: hypothetical protein KDJ52_11335 [Anaerolineae bacterium]|nr:hypothetical protein [Anaerolineae bacterium]